MVEACVKDRLNIFKTHGSVQSFNTLLVMLSGPVAFLGLTVHCTCLTLLYVPQQWRCGWKGYWAGMTEPKPRNEILKAAEADLQGHPLGCGAGCSGWPEWKSWIGIGSRISCAIIQLCSLCPYPLQFTRYSRLPSASLTENVSHYICWISLNFQWFGWLAGVFSTGRGPATTGLSWEIWKV